MFAGSIHSLIKHGTWKSMGISIDFMGFPVASHVCRRVPGLVNVYQKPRKITIFNG